MDEGKGKRVGMARAETNTRERIATRTTRERGKKDDPDTGMSIT